MSSNKNQKNERRKYLENPNTDFFCLYPKIWLCSLTVKPLLKFFPLCELLGIALVHNQAESELHKPVWHLPMISRGTQKEALAGVVVNLQKWSLSILFLLYAQTTLSLRGRSHFSVAWDFGWPLTAWTIEYRERMF